MMVDIENFQSKGNLALDRFVNNAKALPIFNSQQGLVFDAITWNVVEFVSAGRRRRTATIAFKSLGSPGGNAKRPMKEPVGNAVKAAVAHKIWSTREEPGGLSSYRDLARAGQYLAAVVEESGLGGDLQKITHDHLTLAIPRHLSNETQTTIAYSLRSLVGVWIEAGITPQLEGWTFARLPSAQESRLGRRVRRRSLTHDEVHAIAEAFYRAVTPYEQVITSILALLCCAPARMEEVLILPNAVEVLERPGEGVVQNSQQFHEDIRFRFGLRWWPSKGGSPMIKFVPEEMVPVVELALVRLRAHTSSGRELAKWMEDNADVMPLPENLSHVRASGEITTAEIMELFAHDVQRYKNFRPFSRIRRGVYRFDSVEAWWCSQRPAGWPILSDRSKVKYSEALLVFHRNQLSAWSTDPTQIEIITEKQLSAALTPNRGQPSIFERVGVRLPNGAYPSITTHQIRHYLNTIAQRANVPQAHIAYWSGRKNIVQNKAYDHTDILDIVEGIMDRGKESSLSDSVPVILNDGDVVDIDLLEASIKTAVHSTPFGFCVSNLTHEPCSRAMTCTTCTRLVCIVGNMDQALNIKKDIDRRRKAVENMVAMEAKGRRINPRMKMQMQSQLSHVENLLSVLENSENEGSIVRTSDFADLAEFSHGERVFGTRQKRGKLEKI